MKELQNIIIQEARPLPIIILADTSGSMYADNKIGILNNAIREMIDSLTDSSSLRAELQLMVIIFGGDKSTLYQPMTKVNDIIWSDLQAGGRTPMGDTFSMLKSIIENKDIIPSRAYTPTVVLLSDGVPTDDWKESLKQLLSSSRASKAMRMAMSIGAGDEGKEVLKEFLGDSPLNVFESNEARDINKFFKFVTMSVSQRVQSINPNQIIDINIDDFDDELDDFEF
jgi:uncharacterized protein YegL